MANLAQQVIDDVEAVFTNTDDFGVSITYARGANSTAAFSAIVSSSVFETSTEFGIKRVETRDYSFKPSRLVISSTLTLPQRGDKVTEGSRVYLVTEPSGQPCYTYDDENRAMIRVHTVLKTDA